MRAPFLFILLMLAVLSASGRISGQRADPHIYFVCSDCGQTCMLWSEFPTSEMPADDLRYLGVSHAPHRWTRISSAEAERRSLVRTFLRWRPDNVTEYIRRDPACRDFCWTNRWGRFGITRFRETTMLSLGASRWVTSNMRAAISGTVVCLILLSSACIFVFLGTRPNHVLQRTRRERRGCNRCVPSAGSLSLGR